jgi:PIN domain nuclease of toxin-antitoxin system
MAFLLDTHVFFWIVIDSPQLSTAHRELLASDHGGVFVSAVSGWEIATKVRLGKWPQAEPLVPGLPLVVQRAGLRNLPLTLAQAERAGRLSAAHKDPFDRLLAAQAIDQDLTLLTVDLALKAFGCRIA